MATARPKRAKLQVIIRKPTGTTVYNPGDIIPPHIELDGKADELSGGPLFEGTDVPVQYLFHYLDFVRNLYAFHTDYPQVTSQQAFEAMDERIQTARNELIHSHRQIHSGSPVFKGTRVPIDILFEFLASREDLDDFLESSPTVDREQATETLTLAKNVLEYLAYGAAYSEPATGNNPQD